MRHRLGRMPKMQRRAQRLHVIAMASQNNLGLGQELLFFKAGMGAVGLNQFLHRSHIQISRASFCHRPDRRLQTFSARLDHAVLLRQAPDHGAHLVCLVARRRAA
jgi:hypothetical protein